MDWKFENLVVPVSDVDRAKAFYIDKAGFNLDVDHSAGEDFRVVQLTPPGSACSISIMRNAEAAGCVQSLHLVVSDIELARAELVERGVDASEIFHFEEGRQVPGPAAQRLRLVPLVQRPGRQWLASPGGQANGGGSMY